MPVVLFTIHAYGSWLPDRKLGYVERGRGIQPTNVKLARVQRSLLRHAEEHFGCETQRRLIKRFIKVCEEEAYRAHGAGSETSHLHFLTSWQENEKQLKQVGGRIKNLLSLRLSKTTGK